MPFSGVRRPFRYRGRSAELGRLGGIGKAQEEHIEFDAGVHLEDRERTSWHGRPAPEGDYRRHDTCSTTDCGSKTLRRFPADNPNEVIDVLIRNESPIFEGSIGRQVIRGSLRKSRAAENLCRTSTPASLSSIR